jgi:hypothetical protein
MKVFAGIRLKALDVLQAAVKEDEALSEIVAALKVAKKVRYEMDGDTLKELVD